MSEQIVELRKRKRVLPFQVFRQDYEGSWFVGPLGIWPWPLVNILLAIAESIRARSVGSAAQVFPRVATRRTEYVRDAQGRIIEKLEEISVD